MQLVPHENGFCGNHVAPKFDNREPSQPCSMWLPFIPAFIKYVESHLPNADSIRNYFIVLIVSKVPQRSENNKCRQRPLIVALLQYAYSLMGIPTDRRQVSMRLSRLSKLTARRYIKPPEKFLSARPYCIHLQPLPIAS